jgi:hypothetical protein
MAGATYSATPVREQIRRVDRRAKRIALAAVFTVAALLVVLVLALGGDDAQTAGVQPSAPHVESSAPDVTPRAAPGVRYDGGPDEGTRGPQAGSSSVQTAQGIRYDGGPEEGTRGR